MMKRYQLAEYHLFQRLGKLILFNVETMLFYEVDPVISDAITCFEQAPDADIPALLRKKYSRWEVKNAISYLEKEGFLTKGDGLRHPYRTPVLTKRRGIRHLELLVTHRCNMACRYCYGIHGQEEWGSAPFLYGANSGSMSFEVAQKGVDYLFEKSGPRKQVSVIFFGGEPLLEIGLLKQIVPYIREKERETGKKADLSLSTNGLLLTPHIVDFLVENRVGCQVSIDGPAAINNRTRLLVNGCGSYDAIIQGVKRLISRRPGKVPARVTTVHNLVDLQGVVDHLLGLGFGSVHIEPAIGSSGDMGVTQDDVERIKGQNEALALFLVESVTKNRFFNYSNLVKHIRQTRVVRERLAYYCGAGRTYFALAQDGGFYPCHRFVGMESYRMGTIESGVDLTLQKKILSLTVDNRPVCKDCWARYLCGGGCWKHAVDAHGTLEGSNDKLSCQIIQHEIECAMAINSELAISDQDILSTMYEEATEPYLITDKGGA
ncbi:MAG TPA: SPASM domain-containing protein [Syntrophorhabdus sp.]|jgi:uncharacterized protein|nr:SPASM domain-containing protein [Syntrophorhabdus sp.]HQG25262.1 SPASM domain-containing protein [Syntrophorhabdus sp.]HQI96993.1 SPASM domain-containing protein [Syntrophorhabdus sp.]HQM27281.1 SPASM domain-containing protein [Syntrophorhabdus sp.]